LSTVAFKYSVLVVANRTADSPELLEALEARARDKDVSFTLLVPARTVGPQGREDARATMEAAVERLRQAGLEVEGVVGQADPIDAVFDAWDPKRFDEVIVSTLPGAASKWLEVDLPHRVARHTGVTVRHVLARARRRPEPEPVPSRERSGVLAPLNVLTWGGGRER
jgi:Asp-tRNA(Asn)/Glu-tRNA(Gln) amidotransferase A subunit family amidase